MLAQPGGRENESFRRSRFRVYEPSPSPLTRKRRDNGTGGKNDAKQTRCLTELDEALDSTAIGFRAPVVHHAARRE